MRTDRKGIALEIMAPSVARPGEEIEVKVIIKGGGERRTIKRVELVATIEWYEAPDSAIGRHYYFMELLQSLGFFGRFRRAIGEYVFRGDVCRKPVRRVVLARNMELLPRADEEFGIKIKLLAPGFATPGYLWKLRAVARPHYFQNPFASAYIKSVSE